MIITSPVPVTVAVLLSTIRVPVGREKNCLYTHALELSLSSMVIGEVFVAGDTETIKPGGSDENIPFSESDTVCPLIDNTTPLHVNNVPLENAPSEAVWREGS